MPASPNIVAAVEAAIVASAHGAALEQVSAAAVACERLGRLSSGRWRAAGRDLSGMVEELRRSFTDAVEAMIRRSDEIGVPEETLWTVGDAAGTWDLLRDDALDEVDEPFAESLLESDVLLGVSFAEDPEVADRGTTLLFGWADPLAPVSWPWQANWVVGEESVEEGAELELSAAGELSGADGVLPAVSEALSCSADEARAALRAVAVAVTRASLLAGSGSDEEDDEDDQDDDMDGHV